MNLLLIFACLVLNINYVQCETRHISAVLLAEPKPECMAIKDHIFTVGDTVKLITNRPEGNRLISAIYVNGTNRSNSTVLELFNNVQYAESGEVNITYEYDVGVYKTPPQQTNQVSNQNKRHIAHCLINIKVVPGPALTTENLLIIMAVGGVIMGIIIIAEGVAIFHFRKKVKEFKQHNNLLGKGTSSADINDPDRYSTNPIQKAKKMEPSRDSDIYEVPDITLGGVQFNPLMSPPRAEHVAPPFMRMTQQPPVPQQPAFTKPKPPDQDTLTRMALAQRPPMRVPDDEFYSEAQEENMYEPPPPNEVQNRGPAPKKLGIQLPEIPKEAMKPRAGIPPPLKPTKPPITQARPTPQMTRRNEGKPTLPRFKDDKPALPRFPDDKPALPKFPDDKPALPRFSDDKPSLPRFPEETPSLKPVLSRFPGADKKDIKPSHSRNDDKPVLSRFPVADNKPSHIRNQEPEKPAPLRKVIQVPVKPIPGPSTLNRTPAKPKPPVPMPTPAPQPTLEQEVQMFNDNRPMLHPNGPEEETWDEDEWTYEPLYNI